MRDAAGSFWLRMQLRDKGRERERVAERVDEQVPLGFNRFTTFAVFPFFFLSLRDLINLFVPEDLFPINCGRPSFLILNPLIVDRRKKGSAIK